MSDLSKRAVSGTGSFPKKRSEGFQGCNIAKTGTPATLQVPFSGSNKVWWRVQRAPFQRCSLPLGEPTELFGNRQVESVIMGYAL